MENENQILKINRPPRKHGCYPFTFHVNQIIAYVFSGIQIFFFYVFVLNAFNTIECIITSFAYTVTLLVQIYYTAYATFSDPTDPFVTLAQQYELRGEIYTNHELEYFCDYCGFYVGETTKHCKRCNRCCIGFDHHCK